MDILVVDDILVSRKMVRLAAEELGIGVHEAGDGLEALAFLKANPDLIAMIFLDWNMPNMNGFEFLTRIKANDHFKEIPVIMTTTVNERENIIRAIKAGAAQYLIKPYSREDIINKILERTDINVFIGNLFLSAVRESLSKITDLEVTVAEQGTKKLENNFDLFGQVILCGRDKLVLMLTMTMEAGSKLGVLLAGKNAGAITEELILEGIARFSRQVAEQALSYGHQAGYHQASLFCGRSNASLFSVNEEVIQARARKFSAGEIDVVAILMTF